MTFIKKILAVILALSVCFVAGAVLESELHSTQVVLNVVTDEGKLLIREVVDEVSDRAASYVGWLNPTSIAAITAGCVLLVGYRRITGHLGKQRRPDKPAALNNRIKSSRERVTLRH